MIVELSLPNKVEGKGSNCYPASEYSTGSTSVRTWHIRGTGIHLFPRELPEGVSLPLVMIREREINVLQLKFFWTRFFGRCREP